MLPAEPRLKLLPFGAAILVALGAYCVGLRGELNPDEGFYTEAARGVAEGRLPYVHFAYPQMPLLPFIDGIWSRLTGGGLWALRFARVLELGLCAGLGAVALRQRGRVAAIALFTALLVTATPALYYATIVKTYGPAALFLLVAALPMSLGATARRRALIAALGASLAVGVRLTTLPAAVVLLVGLYTTLPPDGRAALRLSALVGAVLILLPSLGDPERFFFWNVVYHARSQINRDRVALWSEFLRLAPGLWAAGLLALAIVSRRRYDGDRRAPPGEAEVWLLAALAGIVGQFAAPHGYGEYTTPFVPLLALGTAAALSPAVRWGAALRWALVTLNLLVVRAPKPMNFRELDEVAEALARNTPPDGYVLTPLPLVAVQAHRHVLPDTELGMFALTVEMTPAEAHRLGMMHLRGLHHLLDRRLPDAVVLTNRPLWNYAGTLPAARVLPPQVRGLIDTTLRQNYHLALRRGSFALWLRGPP